MWQYTTETIINSNKGHLGANKDARFVVDGNKLLIEGVGSFDKDNIAAIYRTAYQDAEKAEGNMVMPTTVVADAVYRLQIWVSEEGTIRPELQNAMLMKSLPFHFEVVAPSATPADLADAFNKAINKMFAKKGADRLFTSELGSSNDIVLQATDCYIRFDEVRIDEVPSGAIDLTGYKNYKPTDAAWSPSKIGTEGNGTVARLIKNMRIPTKASLNPFGSYQGGKPIPGGEYHQYLIQYVVDRSHMGHQVFGSVGDRSMTSHVIFIEDDIDAAFNAELAKLSLEPKTADPEYPNTVSAEVDPKPTKR